MHKQSIQWQKRLIEGLRNNLSQLSYYKTAFLNSNVKEGESEIRNELSTPGPSFFWLQEIYISPLEIYISPLEMS